MLTNQELLTLEKQLSCPEGSTGVELANTMHASNIGMTEATINFLEPKHQDKILELGHGNCHHLSRILEKAEAIEYYGLEVSETMYKEASTFNNDQKQAIFKLYDGLSIPFEDNFFDRIMSVNTIYFWSNPVQLLKEIQRVLKTGGSIVLTFANKSFMETLPFVKQRFKLYDLEKIEELLISTSLQIVDVLQKTEQVKSKTGTNVDREFTLVKIRKT